MTIADETLRVNKPNDIGVFVVPTFFFWNFTAWRRESSPKYIKKARRSLFPHPVFPLSL